MEHVPIQENINPDSYYGKLVARVKQRFPKSFYCNCPKVSYMPGNEPFKGYWTLIENMKLGWHYEYTSRFVPFGSFCLTCKLPLITSVEAAARNCEECGVEYVLKGIPGTIPCKVFLCDSCEGGVVPRRKARRKGMG